MMKTKIMQFAAAAAASVVLLAGAAMASADIPENIEVWPGPDTTVVLEDMTFAANSSGLDVDGDHLYTVDNNPGRLYRLDIAADGTLSFSEGWEDGKLVYFVGTKGSPDTEGVTADGDGFVYLASERDGEALNANDPVIMQVDPEEGDVLTALQQWDLTDLLPALPANKSIEAVEWVADEDVEGILADDNTGEAFCAADYPDMVSGGVFFVGCEYNGHVYAFVLNSDGTAVLLKDIDTGLGGVMALDYDEQEDILWACADSAYSNTAALLQLDDLSSIEYIAPAGADTATHNEGFAIGGEQDGMRVVYHIADGYAEGPLSETFLNADYAG